jgi:hypothetical protein
MSTYSTNLKVQLIGTGEENGTWGTVTNNAFSNVFEQAIVGYATVNFSSDADTTLTLIDGNSSQTARNLYLNLTSSGSLSATRNLIVPNNQAGTAPIQKLYIVKNATTGGRSIQVKTASGTGITIPNGSTMMVYSNGTNVVDVATYFSSLTLGSLTLSTPLPITSGGTGSSSTAYCNLTSNVTGTLPIANGGTGTTSTTFVNLTTNVTGTLPVANGGTGITSFGTNVATWLGTPSSANLAAAVTDETGSGALVFGTSPSLTTPTLTTPTLTTPRLTGSSTGYSTFASANSSATNYTITFPAENMTVGFRNIPNTGTKTSSYTLAVGDVGKYVQIGASGAIVVPNSTFADGDVVTVINTTSTIINITCNTTTANVSGSTTARGGGGVVGLAAYGIASVIFYSSTACIISGAVS